MIEISNMKNEYYRRFIGKYPSPMRFAGDEFYLNVEKIKLKKLKKITIKIDMELIDSDDNINNNMNQIKSPKGVYLGLPDVIHGPNGAQYFAPNAVFANDKDKKEDEFEEKEGDLDEDVKKWLKDKVKLLQYEHVFLLNGIDDMDIVK